MVAIDVGVVEAEGKGMVAVMAAGVVVAETEEVAVTESREPEGPGMNTKIRVEATEAEDVVGVVTLCKSRRFPKRAWPMLQRFSLYNSR